MRPTFSVHAQPLDTTPGFTLTMTEDGAPLTRQRFFEALRTAPAAADALAEAFTGLGLPAIAWETPPLSRLGAERPMVMLALAHPALARAEPDARPFADQIASGAGTFGVTRFQNFGKDAWLVVPCAPSKASAYAHLIPFLRTAPREQVQALFRSVGEVAAAHLAESDAPLWVSTAGMAVSWLHVRLDLRPKYYRTESLRSPSA